MGGMTAIVVVLVGLVLLVAEAGLIWLGHLEDIRREQAYWAARNQRPELFDWSKEPGL